MSGGKGGNQDTRTWAEGLVASHILSVSLFSIHVRNIYYIYDFVLTKKLVFNWIPMNWSGPALASVKIFDVRVHLIASQYTPYVSTQYTSYGSNYESPSSSIVIAPTATPSHVTSSNVHVSIDSPNSPLSQVTLEQENALLQWILEKVFSKASPEARSSMGYGVSKGKIAKMTV
jgi:hypothetical protein